MEAMELSVRVGGSAWKHFERPACQSCPGARRKCVMGEAQISSFRGQRPRGGRAEATPSGSVAFLPAAGAALRRLHIFLDLHLMGDRKIDCRGRWGRRVLRRWAAVRNHENALKSNPNIAAVEVFETPVRTFTARYICDRADCRRRRFGPADQVSQRLAEPGSNPLCRRRKNRRAAGWRSRP